MLILFALGSLIGATVCNCMRALYIHYIWWFTVFGLICILFINGCLNKQSSRMLCALMVGAIIGFSWVTLKAQSLMAWELPWIDINRSLSIKATVVEGMQLSPRLFQFDAILHEYDHQNITKKPKIRLYAAWNQMVLRPGDKITGIVKLKPPWNYANPGGMDIEKALFVQGIRAIGNIVKLENIQHSNQYKLTQWRLYLNERINTLIPDYPFKGVMIATSLGFNQYITPEQWQVFRNTGTAHTVAISGLHITLVASLCASIVIFCTRRMYNLTLWMPAQYIGALFGFGIAFIYCLLAGCSIPTQRAFFMSFVALLALIKRQAILTWTGLAIAWLIIGFSFPFSTLQTGFWLSFGCVAALIYGRSHFEYSGWRKWLMPQCIVFIALIPLSAFFFQQVSVVSIVANTLVLPVMSILVIPCSLLALVCIMLCDKLAILVLYIGNSALGLVWSLLENMANWSWSVMPTKPCSEFTLCIGILGVLWLLLPQGFWGRHIGWFAFIPLFYGKSQTVQFGEFRFALLDVGQGLAAIVHTRNHHLLFDAGPPYAGKRIIMPYFNHYGIYEIDKVVISHSDLDHRGGLPDITLPIRDLISSDIRLASGARLCKAGQTWAWDGITFEFLNGPSLAYTSKNNASCVLKISNGFQSVLLTGDIEYKAEQLMLSRNPEALKSTVLVVPHHGSKTSSSVHFIQAVAPQFALFPVGLANRFGFPKDEIIQRYWAQHSDLLNTDETGAIIFHFQAKQELTPPIRWRDTDYHYWNNHTRSGGKR